MITVDEIMACCPCADYPRERVAELCGSGVTAAQVLAADIPNEDKHWLLTNVLARRDRVALIAWVWRCLAAIDRDCPAWRAMIAAPGNADLARAAADAYAYAYASHAAAAAARAAYADDAAYAASYAARAARAARRAARAARAYAVARSPLWVDLVQAIDDAIAHEVTP